MIRKSEVEMQKHEITKVTRALIRLKHSVQADREINDVLPDKLAEFDIALQQGQLLGLPEGWAEEVSDEINS